MIPITEIVKGIFKIGPLDTHKDTAWTAPFLVVGEQRAAIVELGEDGQAPDLLQAIGGHGEGQLDYDLNRIAYLIPSHIHLHHVRGVNELLKAIPKAKVVVHQRGVPHLIEPARLNASTAMVWGKGTGCAVELTPVPKDRIMSVAGGEVLDLGGRELELIETTGHAPHHISIFDRRTRTLFPGDAAGAFFAGPGHERTRPDILPPLFDVEKELDSVRRLRALKPSLLLVFGHNALSYSPDKTLQWLEEDIRAVERIVLDGMKKKTSSMEIGKLVHNYYNSVGIGYEDEATMRASEEAGGMRRTGEGPIGLYAYLIKKDPTLQMPK